jgi:hypothetical protein
MRSLRMVMMLLAWMATAGAIGSAYADDAVKDSAAKLAASIRKAGLQRVAVVPILFVQDDRTNQQKGRLNNNLKATPFDERKASVSSESLRIAEEMERYLGTQSGGAFRLVPSIDLYERVDKSKTDLSTLNPRGEALAKLINTNGDIDGMIVGSVKRFYKTRRNNAVGIDEIEDELQSIEWNLIELSNRAIADTAVKENVAVSLAEAVYGGYSAEFFRYEGGKLRCLLDYRPTDRTNVPLSPSESEFLFRADGRAGYPAHPLMNPNCPFKVSFEVDGKALPVTYAIQEFGFVRVLDALINLEPGDEPLIRVRNTLPNQVMVAVFLDGVNHLGRRRELPDKECQPWKLEPNSQGVFRKWFKVVPGLGEIPTEEEEFLIRDWTETVAGQMGSSEDALASRMITLVFFTEGLPSRNSLLFYDKTFTQTVELTQDRKRFVVTESQAQIAGAAPNAFGVGGINPKKAKLNMVQTAGPGTILASMTIAYCPKADTKRTMAARLKSRPDPQSDFKLVEIPPRP